MSETIFYVGTEIEAAHHARPLQSRLPNLQVAEPASVLKVARPGDCVILFSEHFDRFRDLCIELKYRQIPTIYAIDGILEWRNAWENRDDELACPWAMRPCLSDVVACIGPRQRAILDSWGNRGRVYNIGIPRFDKLVESFLNRGSSHSPLVESAHSLRLLVVTAKCPGFTPQQWKTTLESLQAIHNLVQSRTPIAKRNLEVQWRLTGGLDQQLGVANSSKIALTDQIAQSDIVVSTASTVILESMLLDKPTVLLDFHNTPAYVPTAWTVTHVDHLEPVLQQIATSTGESPKMALQRYLLSESLQLDSDSSGTMAELISAVVQRAEQCRKQGIWNFEKLLVNQDEVAKQSSMDPASSGSTSRWSELGAMDFEQIAAYASQLKRENQRLNRLVNEAHVVFDHMQGHPVLGTILKTHKWFSEQILKRPANLQKPSELEER